VTTGTNPSILHFNNATQSIRSLKAVQFKSMVSVKNCVISGLAQVICWISP